MTLSNHQRIEMTGARMGRGHGRGVWPRGASFQSVVGPARRRFVKPFSYAFCFFDCLLGSSTYAEIPIFGHSCRGLPRCKSRQIMTAKKHFVQSNGATARHTSGSNLTPKTLNLRQVRREAAASNNSPEPTPIGAASPHSRAASLVSARLIF
jgi:hypothetical protein